MWSFVQTDIKKCKITKWKEKSKTGLGGRSYEEGKGPHWIVVSSKKKKKKKKKKKYRHFKKLQHIPNPNPVSIFPYRTMHLQT
jgi:hypothetical protein